MPSTIEELEAAIEDCKSEANSILCLNRNVLEEYEHRLRQVIFGLLSFYFIVSFSSWIVYFCFIISSK